MSDKAEKVEPLPVEELETQPMSKMDVRPSQTNQFRKDPLRVYCLHQTDEGEMRSANQADPFEVVPDDEDAVDIVYIVYGGDKNLEGPSDLELVSESQGRKVYALECSHKGDLEKSFISRAHWKSLKTPTVANVTGTDRDIKIKTYPSRKHRLAFEFPAMREIEGGSKVGGMKKKKEGGEKKDSVNKTKGEESSWESWKGMESPDSPTFESDTPPPIRYSVDGEPVEQNVLELAGAVLELGKRILTMYRTVRDNVPKVGWYFEADFQLMQGVFVLSWQWREHHDHRAFLWVGAMMDIDILSASVEIGIGVEGFGFALQLYGRVNGSLGVTASLQRASPDMGGKLEIPLNAEIKGLLGVRFEAGNSVQATGKFVTALKFSGGLALDTDEGASIETGIEWTGIAGVIVGSVSFAGVYGYEKRKDVTLVDESDLGSWKWPRESTYEPERVSDSEMKSIMKEKLTSGLLNQARVRRESGELVETDAILDSLARNIEGSRILRDEKTIEALSHDIRQRLEQIESDYWLSKDSLSYDRFMTFCEEELPTFLDNYVDPMAEAQRGMSSGA